MSFSRNRIWLAFDLNHPEEWAVDDKSNPPSMPSGRAVEFRIALYDGDALDNLAEFTSFTLEVKEQTNEVVTPGAAALMSLTVSAAAFNTALTDTEWQAKSAYHVAFAFAEGLTGLTEATYALLITGQGTAGTVEIGRALLVVYKSGALTNPAEPTPADPVPVRQDIYIADKEGFIKKFNPSGTTFAIQNADGYALEFYITDGANPELKTRVISPPA